MMPSHASAAAIFDLRQEHVRLARQQGNGELPSLGAGLGCCKSGLHQPEPISALGPACVKTRASKECAELFSPFSSFDCDSQCCSFPIQRNRDEISTRKFDVGVFTQAGSFSTELGCPQHVRFTPVSDQTADNTGGPFRATSGSQPLAARVASGHATALPPEKPNATQSGI